MADSLDSSCRTRRCSSLPDLCEFSGYPNTFSCFNVRKFYNCSFVTGPCEPLVNATATYTMSQSGKK